MTESLRLSLTLLVLTLGSFAQTAETFDIATFTPPTGWKKQVTQNSLQLSTEDKQSAYCLITLFKALPAIGNADENFQASWDTIVKETVTVNTKAQMMPSDNKGEWKALGGFSPFESNGQKGVAVLLNISGYGKMVNVLVLTNTMTYEPTITAFLESVSLKKPAEESRPQIPGNQNGSQPSLAGNFWKQGGVRGGMLGHSGLSTGSFSKTYHFFANGTYKFYREDMQLAAPKYYLEHEDGTYSVSGNTITITARKSSYSQHRLSKEDPPAKSGNLPLTTAQYRFEFWLHDGNWALLLSPVDGNETKRDGTFSFWRNGEAQRTYQYVLVDANGRLIR